jgi:hypothetical protein
MPGLLHRFAPAVIDADGRTESYCLWQCLRRTLPSGTANSTWGIVGRLYGVVSRRRLD